MSGAYFCLHGEDVIENRLTVLLCYSGQKELCKCVGTGNYGVKPSVKVWVVNITTTTTTTTTNLLLLFVLRSVFLSRRYY
ncbi:MAG TPA: hypothetical protein VHF65_00080 [Nitrososphaera sp.]|nr:hypothetical protein [Nitrososphaera sp.]